MRRILCIARREYIATVFTKGFLFGLIFAPLMMGAGLIVIPVMQHVEVPDRRIAVMDHTGILEPTLAAAAAEHNRSTRDRPRSSPGFHLEFVAPSEPDTDRQRLELADRIRAGKLDAFLEISPDALRPGTNLPGPWLRYYAKSSALDEARGWLDRTVNEELRRRRLVDAGLDPARVRALINRIAVEGMTLPDRDRSTGAVRAARKESEFVTMGIPMIAVMLAMMLVLTGAMPLLQGVLEEKSQRIAEVLLGCASPGEIMAGKLVGGLGVTLTSLSFYASTGTFALRALTHLATFPVSTLIWLAVFVLAAVPLYGAVALALGSACNDAKDAQHMQLPLILPLMLPTILAMAVLRDPNGSFATWISFFPPFTPLLMVLRISAPGSVPAWQPWLGLAGVFAATALTLWLAGRIFRVGLLMQGKPPRLREILRWGLRG